MNHSATALRSRVDFSDMDGLETKADTRAEVGDLARSWVGEAPNFEVTALNVLFISATEWARFEARVNGAAA
jgi:hypothetical protein